MPNDPRGEFKTAKFRDDVSEIKHLQIGMELEGVVTNVTAFGCFVDIGVHQDGLVHISELSDSFVADPADVVKPQDIVKVRVLSVDEPRKRIGLSMKSPDKKEVPKSDKSDKAFKDKTNAKPSNKPNNKPKREFNKAKNEPAKVGSFGALLKQAGLK